MSTVEVRNLVKIFTNKKKEREVRALDGISFSIHPGEIFGLLGPNGAGKTTTIRILAGLYSATEGTVQIFGHDISEYGDRVRKHMGILTENHGNYENLTIYENLHFFASFYDIPDIEGRIRDLMTQFHLSDRKAMRVGQLSKGLKQRVAIARVLLPDPSLIFFDEPTAGLDPQAAVEVREIIRDLQQSHRTILLNSHNLEEVQKVCDRVAILDKGKIVQVGTAAELSQGLFGGQEFLIIAKDEIPENVVGKLTQLPGIVLGEAAGRQIVLRLASSEVVVPEILPILHHAGVRVLEMKRVNHSLEDIYLALMTESRHTAGGSA